MTEVIGFVKNHQVLEEDYRINDLLDFSEEIKSFEKRLDTIQNSAIVGLVGKFGSGKSTMLHQIQKNRSGEELWINFDAWKFPDRKDLWEGFVIDFADQIGEKGKAINQIDGRSTSSNVLDVAGNINDKLSFMPGLSAVLGLVRKLINNSPATRIFEIQEILKKLIEKQTQNIFLILEDIDRSGDAGIFFLETLKQFIRSQEFLNNLMVIVPISNKNYKKNKESYLKVLDYTHDFIPENIGLGKFVEEIFDNKLFEGEIKNKLNNKVYSTGDARKSQIINFLEVMIKKNTKISIRYLKFILRKANLSYILQQKDNHQPDCRVTICLEFAKHLQMPDDNKTYFHLFLDNQKINTSNFFAAFLFAMIENSFGIEYKNSHGDLVIRESPLPVSFITRKNNDYENYPSYPWESGYFGDDKKFYICDFYLKY